MMELLWMITAIFLLVFIFLQALANIRLAMRIRRLDVVVRVHLKHHAETFGDYVKKRSHGN